MNAEEVAQLHQQMQFLANQVNDLQQQQQQQQQAAFVRVKPRKPNDFTGTSKELTNWLYSMALYCNTNGITTDEAKIQTALPYLKGDAATWLQRVYPIDTWTDCPWSTWFDFCTALRSTFGVLQEHVQARERLDALTQRRNQGMDGYVRAWRMILLDLPELAQDEIVHRFKKGLYYDKVRQYITQATVGRSPKDITFEELSQLAMVADADLVPRNDKRDRVHFDNSAPHWQSRARHDSRPAAMDIGNIRAEPVSRDALLRQGRCFYCHERGHVRANCPALKKKQGNGGHRQ